MVVLLNLFMLTAVAVADETLPTLKVGKETYSHVNVFQVTATDIYFTSDQGLANAKLKDLDPGLQKHFNYNPTNAAAVEQKEKAANNLYHAEIAKSSAAKDAGAAPGTMIEPETGKQIWAKPFLNQHVPPVYIEKWLNGRPDDRGKFVLIEFWATWCPACRAAIPELNDFEKKFGDKMIVMGLSDEPESVVRNFNGPEVDYFIGIDTQARTKKALGVTGIPHVIIIDPNGIVRWEGFPFLKGYELTEKVVADIIAKYSN